jgi:hypothetical protein
MNNPNITALEEIGDIIPEINLENENSSDSNLAFTFGFTAGLWDLNHSQNTLNIQAPEDKALIVLDVNDYGSKSVPIKPIIDTQKLLSNYNNGKIPSNGRNNSVTSILQNLNLPNDLIETFEKHEVDIEAFKLLRRKDLLEMGIKNSKIIDIIIQTVNKKGRK